MKKCLENFYGWDGYFLVSVVDKWVVCRCLVWLQEIQYFMSLVSKTNSVMSKKPYLIIPHLKSPVFQVRFTIKFSVSTNSKYLYFISYSKDVN